MRHLEIRVHADHHGPVVSVTGQLDMATAERVEAALRAAEADTPPVLTLDYSALEFVDSTGLQILLDADHRARQADRRLRVALGDGEARRVALLADVASRLSITDLRP